MTVEVRSQRIARAAFQRVEARERDRQVANDKYLAFARSFPTLIHTSGLAQACAFARAKRAEKLQVLDDLADVMNAADEHWQLRDGKALDDIVRRRETDANTYIRLTRVALQSATWIKRYAEALLPPAAATTEPADNEATEEP